MSTAIVWLRQDLRCEDNPALAEACGNYELIIPLYIAEDNSDQQLGGAQRWWLHHSLLALRDNLTKYGLNLCLKKGRPLAILAELVKQHNVDAVYWNRCYEPASIARDKIIKEKLKNKGLKVQSFNSHLFNEPWTIRNKQDNYFKVFTPYWRHCLTQINIPPIHELCKARSPNITTDSIESWELLPSKPNWAKGFSKLWEPGEEGAVKQFDRFINEDLSNYKTNRDEPCKAATSHLSPHLHFGEISVWQIWRALEAAKLQPQINIRSIEIFLAELGWREFSYYLLYHFPDLPSKNFKEEFDQFPWQTNKKAFTRWQQGLTGFPIVDAGMRQLWQTGYMHNRVRMIVASFLIKDLLIDWRLGAEWFWYTLLDADLANNSASWQWVAGTGADSAPYFRIFNPVLQGEKFDPHGDYVKNWVPELAKLAPKWIHKPWEAPSQELPITLGQHYPYPLINHSEARKIALDNYQLIKRKVSK